MLLEIVSEGDPIVQAALAVQRRFLEEHVEGFRSLDLLGKSLKEREATLQEDFGQVDAVLLRGVGIVDLVVHYFPKAAVFVDCCAPIELGKTSPLTKAIRKVRRAYCYSESLDSTLRKMGLGRVTTIPGPAIPTEVLEHSPELVVGVLRSCTTAKSVLIRLLKIREKQGWPFKVASAMALPKVDIVCEDDFEVAELSRLIVAPSEDKDYGEPHSGALLALAVGRPLVTTRSGAFNLMGFPGDNFLPAQQYQIGTYAAAVGNYLQNPAKYDAWTEGSGPDPLALPKDLVSRI